MHGQQNTKKKLFIQNFRYIYIYIGRRASVWPFLLSFKNYSQLKSANNT